MSGELAEMKPRQRHNHDIAAGLVNADRRQRQAVLLLDRLYDDLHRYLSGSTGPVDRFKSWWSGEDPVKAAPAGIYLWGGVGRGKTYLMDLFYDCLPCEQKLRMHFHRFMQGVHKELASLQGQKNPLQQVAGGIARQAKILCLDEFLVLDIGDAMILAGLLEALFQRDLILVTTANIHPGGLYENGLQRERFLPAIELLKTNTRVVEIGSGIDYRLRSLSQATLYHSPIDQHTDELLLRSFHELAPDKAQARPNQMVPILEREIPSRYCANDVAWFEFEALCDGPRSVFDYVELARLFHAVILSGVPVLDDSRNDQVRRFINLIDELYDRRVKLIVAAQASIHELYRGQRLAFEFQRTRSRLTEMQSHDYLGCGRRA